MIEVGATGGYEGTVTLSASGLPAGATASFFPPSIEAPGTSTLTIAVDFFPASGGTEPTYGTNPPNATAPSTFVDGIAVYLTGVFLCTRALVGRMLERRYGRIVNIASVAGKEGGPNACAYAAAKSGVIGFTKGLAQELAGSGVLANCIAPAITETDLFAEMTDDYIADRKRRIPMGRFCTIKEIADMTAFAASPECSFTTGSTFDVSGGRATY